MYLLFLPCTGHIDCPSTSPHQYDPRDTILTMHNYAHRLLLLLPLIIAPRSSIAAAQTPTNDKPTFSTAPGFADLRECARCPLHPAFRICSDESVPEVLGCGTNKCLCESHLEEAVDLYGQSVLELCNSNTDDQRTTTAFLRRYCEGKGGPTGASIVTVTATVQVTVTASAAPVQPPPLRPLYAIIILVVIAVVSGVGFFEGQRLIRRMGRQ
jgi:hypothetical protein